MKWDIRRDGHKNSKSINELFEIMPEKIEVIDGKFFHSDGERLAMLAILLENCGIDEAIKFGDIKTWKEAIQAYEDK